MGIIRAILMVGAALSFASPIQAPYDQIWAGKFGAFKDHPGHYPFISCWTFRSIADHVIDHAREFDPDIVQKGDIIYLNCWYLPWFESHIHDKIKHPYILVTCDTNSWLPYPFLKRLIHDPKCAAWFGRNMLFSHHPKLFQIPMGQDLSFFDHGFETKKILEECIASPKEKERLLYMNFFARKAADRQKIVELFENVPYCFSRNKTGQEWNILGRREFYNELSASQYTLSPWGVEFECIRTWEAILLGSIPIVEHSFLDPLYSDLPILLVHKWEDIDEKMLRKNYDSLKKKSTEKATFDYWESLIKEIQFQVRYGQPSSEVPFAIEDLLPFFDPHLPELIYRGSLTLLRPLKLTPYFTKIYLFDRWFHEHLRKEPKIDCTLLMEHLFEMHLQRRRPCQIFLDLTHLRGSLLRDDEILHRDWELIRHSLKEDLYALFDQLKVGSRLIGNMTSDPYVSEVLAQITEEKHWLIEKKGDFWLLHKTIETAFPTSFEQLSSKFSSEMAEIDAPLTSLYLQDLSIRCKTSEALSLLKSLDLSLDLLYIQNSSSLDADLRAWAPLLKREGTICGENWNQAQSEIGAFAQDHALKVSYQGSFWKLLRF